MSEQAEREAASPATAAEPAIRVEDAAPRMYRAMKADDEHPKTGTSGTTLGIRVPKDIPVDLQGRVRPGKGGLSVRPRIRDIPAEFLPRRLKHLNRNATGSDKTIVFRYGEKAFTVAHVTSELCLRPDKPDHGVVEPSAEMDFDAYQNALHATREGWVNGEEDAF
ncbi:hypothetical protein [Chondromyces crocatus]|uniref:Uncharacterized protein n=1 Tax=Chondromyces crocatus TaxID=52 RepID=A0A0K1EF77_CHOCO|nr:hypothetical protein [Chondromyces crocatus]AKT39347.1 uncharacterized protein CMC5_034940 [Chondromyces crocatus]